MMHSSDGAPGTLDLPSNEPNDSKLSHIHDEKKEGNDDNHTSSSDVVTPYKHDRDSPPDRWWNVLVRKMGENKLGAKSITSLVALVTVILWLSYKFYWKSSRETRSNNTNPSRQTKKKNSLASFSLYGWWRPLLLRSMIHHRSNNNNNKEINNNTLPRRGSTQEVPLSTLLQAAKAGAIERVLFRSSQIWFQTKTTTSANDRSSKGDQYWQTAHLPPTNQDLQSDLLDLLQRSGASISALPDSIWQKLATPVLAALPFVYLVLLYRMMQKLQNGDHDTKRIGSKSDATRTRTTFADVAGLDHVITEVAEIVQYLHRPQAYHGVGARPPQAVLLHGPPGSGKTLLARAVAGEAHTYFVSCSASEFVETYVGRGAARVRSVFRQARTEALKLKRRQSKEKHGSRQNQTAATAILFIDELDALAKTRSSGLSAGSNDERDQTLNQLLTEMDGFLHHHDNGMDDDNVTLIVMAATNRADVLDPAILRRFDRQVFVGYPDAEGRQAILLVHAKKITCDTHAINWEWLASEDMTANFSGADLRNVVNEAALLAVRGHCPTVQENHLIQATQRLRDMKKRLQQPTHHHHHHASNRQFLPPFFFEPTD